MFLRSLTLKGFKSFAEKTTLEFAPGVSVIVGPNGSGKSNLVDAISWVLGEQGARALRGGQMADVIFAGSPKRAALGMAEVQLVIDNEAGAIPVPMTEISISRGIFRAGDSEYRIGGQLVRLMDIQELLSDSGIGRALHTVVGQGQLEDVLTARPEERRQYIEEAAGIAKHRRRKERAQRKLGSLEQDVLRLQDVLAELRRQLKPLKHQAESAKRHEKLTAEAEETSWRLAAARLRSLLEARDAKRPSWEEGVALRQQGKERLEALDAAIERLADERARAAVESAAAEEHLRETREALDGADIALREAERRASDAKTKLASEGARSLRASTLAAEIARTEAAVGSAVAELAERERELEDAEAEFRRAEDQRREAEDDRHRLTEESAAHRAEMETMRRSLAAYERERGRIEETLSAARSRTASAERELEDLAATLERLRGEIAPLEQGRLSSEGERDRLTSEAAGLEEELRRLFARRDLLEARRGDLDETAGSRFLQRNPGRAIGLLRDLATTEAGLERALSAALGPYGDAVVYEQGQSALDDAHQADGAVLAAGDALPANAGLEGGRPLIDRVEADPRARGLLSAILADVYIVDDLDTAIAIQREHPHARLVTASGVMVGRGVIHTAAGTDSRATEIHSELALIEENAGRRQATLAGVRRRLEATVGELADLTNRIAGLTEQASQASERSSRTDSELASASKEVELLTQRLSGMDEAADAWRAALESAPVVAIELPPLPTRPEPPVGARVAVEALRRERINNEASVKRLRAEQIELAAETPETLRASLEAAEGDLVAATEARAVAESANREAIARRDAATETDRAAVTAETEANRQWREAAAELDRLRETYEEQDRDRGEVERRIAEAERLLSEGHGKGPEEALGALAEADNAAELERRSEVIARRLTLLGRVNLLASGEFEALQERHDFMERELDDVRKARRDLMEVVRRVDDEVVALFDAAFRDVATEFEQMFKELFPGGEGRLVLTDPADLLETGIEVEARPGKKRVKRLSLLSGGERSLTALCFLFSIFRARPSPFYLLDEVEAALDDVNLHRFLGLIRGFARHSQVLIVSHQKRTMEIADMLYGVSIGPDGSSRVVCQKLDHEEALNVEPLAAVSEPRPVN